MANSSSFLKITVIHFCLIVFLVRPSLDVSAEDLSNREYIIGPDDVIEIQVWDNEDLNRTVEITQEGDFAFPLIGRVHAEGLSVYELGNLIKKRLADGYIIKPQISVSVIEYNSKKVFVLGEVQNPGSYAIKRKWHLIELISEAGGFTDKAGRIITIVRPKSTNKNGEIEANTRGEKNKIIMIDLGEFKADLSGGNIFVENGDSIFVKPIPPIKRIFVSGQVNKPGELEWKKGLTVRQAISLAGGPTNMAAQKRIAIIRIENNGKENEIKARMDDLVKPDDIIKVPERYF